MKYIESVLSFILALAGIVFQPKGKRKPPCCPCPFVEEETPSRPPTEGEVKEGVCE